MKDGSKTSWVSRGMVMGILSIYFVFLLGDVLLITLFFINSRSGFMHYWGHGDNVIFFGTVSLIPRPIFRVFSFFILSFRFLTKVFFEVREGPSFSYPAGGLID